MLIFIALLMNFVILQADCIKASLQALMEGVPTFVRLPRAWWHSSWHQRFRDPVVRLLRALYGHPLAGEMWHQHIEKAIKNLGYESMIEWPSVYFKGFGATLILIVLYVDDLLIAAAKELAHRALTELRQYIQIGEPSDISKYLGCNHHLDTENGISRCRFDMRAYLKAAYNDFTKRANTKPKPSATPYAPELPKAQSDELIARPGIYATDAAHYLMRLMFAARMACPDLALAIQRLACNITKWSADCDRRLVRIYGYIAANPDYMLTGFVNTKFIGHPRIVAWPDADLAGDPNTSRSTSGHYIELCTGDQHHFPLSWGCRRQTSTSCHTCEAETVSLATCLRQQALPAQQLLDRLLGQSIDLFIKEDNSATISAIQRGYSPVLRYPKRTQRIDIGFLHETTSSPHVFLEKADTAEHKGDFFTKPLNITAFRDALYRINVINYGR